MLQLDADNGVPLFQQIYSQVREDILSGAMPEGARLPSIRAMARQMRLGKNTVESAYAQLALEGYVSARPGSGYTVNSICGIIPATHFGPAKDFLAPSNAREQERLQTFEYDFSYENSDGSIFPADVWRKLTAEVLSDNTKSGYAAQMHRYGAAGGYMPLRRQLAAYLYQSRGVRCAPEQVILCSGLQPSIMTILHLLQAECRMVALEDPGYDGARTVYECFGIPVVPVPVDASGMDIAVLAGSSVRLAHIAPSHQFPTGVVTSISRRMELLQWAVENDAFIIEDDYDSELRYNGRPIPSMQSIDPGGRVIYLGTFSKVLSPGMRMSYMVLPSHLHDRFNSVFASFQCTVPWLEQAVLHRFMADGHWEKHLRKLCLFKKKKHDVFVNTVNALWDDHARIHGHNAGLHILLELVDGPDENEMAARAKAIGIRVYPASRFWADKTRCPKNCLFLGYGMLSEADIISALNALKTAWS